MSQDPISKKTLHKIKAAGVTQHVGSEFKTQYHKENILKVPFKIELPTTYHSSVFISR
jgi:hypothetical protein